MKRCLSGNEIAVSSVVGIVVILAITLLSIGIMILYTLPAINDMQDMAKTQKAEQAFTVFDSRTSKAALGESPLQTTSLSLMGGNVEVMGTNDTYNESQIMIVMLSSNASWYDEFYQNSSYWGAWKSYENKTDFAGINSDMGKIVYTYDDRTVAYEGGGVWSKYGNGGTIMISPPEFHFNGETLTLPIMKISGNTSVAGTTNTDITVVSSNTPTILFPNASQSNMFVNPLNLDKIIIYIKSDYYDGWGDYAETLTSTTATYDHQNKTAILDLDTLPPMGTFPLMQSFEIKNLNESNPEPMENFSYFFEAPSGNAANFKPPESYVTAIAGPKSLIYVFNKADTTSVEVSSITYTDTRVSSDPEIWNTDPSSSFPVNEAPDQKKLANCTYDLLSDTYVMQYSNSDREEYSWNVTSLTTMIPDIIINDTDPQSLNNITQHYFKLMAQEGTIDCTWTSKTPNNPKINIANSSYNLEYDAGGGIIAYLHITSNELEVNVN
jgi:hypothetical protein